MQNVSQLFNTILSGAYEVEHRFIIDSTTYTQSDVIGEPIINASLFDKYGIGNCVAKTLDLEIIPKGTIPRMAQIKVQMRVKNTTQVSEWLSKGTFFIDTRSENITGSLKIIAYDAMLKAEYVYLEEGTWQSTTSKALITAISSTMGVGVDASTQTLLQSNPFSVDFIPSIGTNGTTARELLSNIATIYGGNFIIDDFDNLKLVLL